MATINQLPLLTTLEGGDQLVLWSTANGDTRRMPYSAFKSAILSDTAIGYMTMIGNAVATDIVTQSVAVKIAGNTTADSVTQGFTHSNNRLTYTGTDSRIFRVTAIASFSSGNNNQVLFYVAQDGSPIAISETYATANSSGRFENAVVQGIVTLAPGGYVEIWTANDSATTDVTVSDLSVIVQALN